MKAAALAIALVALPGCAGLALRDDDGRAERAAKVTTRVLLTVATLATFPKLQADVEEREAKRLDEEMVLEDAARFRRRWLVGIAGARTAAELTALFGRDALFCRDSPAEAELCVWASGRALVRPGAWPSQPAGRIDFDETPDPGGDGLGGLVIARCAIPRDGSPRGDDSCDVSFW